MQIDTLAAIDAKMLGRTNAKSNLILSIATASVGLLILSGSTGCVSFAANMLNAIYGNESKPEFEGMKDQRIAIICSNESGIGKDETTNRLAANIRTAIGNKLTKATIIRQEEIDGWLRDNPNGLDASAQIGKAVKADYVISVDMRNLKVRDGQTLYRGRADYSVEVYSPSKEKIVFRKSIPEYTYPQEAAISTTEMDEAKFRRIYLTMAGEKISRLFISSPMGADIATDARMLQFQ